MQDFVHQPYNYDVIQGWVKTLILGGCWTYNYDMVQGWFKTLQSGRLGVPYTPYHTPISTLYTSVKQIYPK